MTQVQKGSLLDNFTWNKSLTPFWLVLSMGMLVNDDSPSLALEFGGMKFQPVQPGEIPWEIKFHPRKVGQISTWHSFRYAHIFFKFLFISMQVYQSPQIPMVQWKFPHWITAPGQCSPIKFHPGQLPPDFYSPDNYTRVIPPPGHQAPT